MSTHARVYRIAIVLMVVVTAVVFGATTASARSTTPAQVAPPTLEELIAALTALAGLFAAQGGTAALVEAVVALLKRIGVVADGTAGWWSFGLNLAAFVAFIAFNVFGGSYAALDNIFGSIAALLMAVLGTLVQFVGPAAIYERAKAGSVPVLGYSKSNSLRKVG